MECRDDDIITLFSEISLFNTKGNLVFKSYFRLKTCVCVSVLWIEIHPVKKVKFTLKRIVKPQHQSTIGNLKNICFLGKALPLGAHKQRRCHMLKATGTQYHSQTNLWIIYVQRDNKVLFIYVTWALFHSFGIENYVPASTAVAWLISRAICLNYSHALQAALLSILRVRLTLWYTHRAWYIHIAFNRYINNDII